MTDTDHLTTDELERLNELGASAEFLAIVQQPPESVGATRNSAREGVRRAFRGDYGPDATDAEGLLRRGGGYFEALFEGNLADAYYRADATNTALLFEVFSPEYLIERLVVEDNRDRDSAERHVRERVERYGKATTA